MILARSMKNSSGSSKPVLIKKIVNSILNVTKATSAMIREVVPNSITSCRWKRESGAHYLCSLKAFNGQAARVVPLTHPYECITRGAYPPRQIVQLRFTWLRPLQKFCPNLFRIHQPSLTHCYSPCQCNNRTGKGVGANLTLWARNVRSHRTQQRAEPCKRIWQCFMRAIEDTWE